MGEDTDAGNSPILVVLGKNWRRDRSDPSLESKMIVIAAGEIYRREGPVLLVFSGGHTAGPDYPSEAAAMSRLLRRIFPQVPAEAVLLEERSIDTADNAARVHELLGDECSIALLTTAAHGPAARHLFQQHGMQVREVYAAEDVLRLRSPHHRALLRRYSQSWRARAGRAVERLRAVLMVVDPEARSLRVLTRLLRR